MFRPALLAVILLTAVALPAQAESIPKQPAAQRWGQTDSSEALVTSNDPRNPRSAVSNFTSEIYFDPKKLDDSSMILSMGFDPMINNPADKAAGDSPEEAAQKKLHGAFVSKRIRKLDKNTYEAEGDLMFGNRKIPTKIPFTANFQDGLAEPMLVFDGAFNVPTAQVATGKQLGQYPGQLPLNFRITAVPIKQ